MDLGELYSFYSCFLQQFPLGSVFQTFINLNKTPGKGIPTLKWFLSPFDQQDLIEVSGLSKEEYVYGNRRSGVGIAIQRRKLLILKDLSLKFDYNLF
jgi:hypothetical protein